ncbi:AbrB/MazE/SpoVT family DNA-binding domain-containing protein [Rhizobium sp. C1]|uniref:AbrB/MazE/SpoVT family DNA-binding domain-containing protein n=1 Tax=Rhizobium sp. C1 TaxID=1349799 RepID=UPI001E60D48C|nr:AbrB/MazE/SpoVT family DNA-binding domain-containing protein [Rhizobium sp. C1]MCD2176624.1 AbrB/MazE/SpoVT family DNA-binding domain-containing protein [Rhizobium sp. C1]
MPKVVISKWGNSSAIRLPKAMMDDLGLKNGSVVRLEKRDGAISVVPETRRIPTIREMVEEMERLGFENEPDTVDWGPDVGSERFYDHD